MSASDRHPISLEAVIFVKSFVQAVPEHEPVEGLVLPPPENSIHVQKLPERGTGAYGATMRTILNPNRDKAHPYFIDMECMAVLHADDSISEEEAVRGVTITAHNVLFGAIREAVSWLTARQPYGPITLGLSILRPKEAAQGKQE